ncbi:g9414 [Coccomyxa elongata]
MLRRLGAPWHLPPQPQLAVPVLLATWLGSLTLQIYQVVDTLAFKKAIWLSEYLPEPSKQRLLITACTVLSAACSEAATQTERWAAMLRFNKSTVAIAPGTPLPDIVNLNPVHLSDFADKWTADIAPAIQKFLENIPLTSETALSCARAVGNILYVGAIFAQLVNDNLDGQLPAAAQMLDLNIVQSAVVSPMDGARQALQTLAEIIQKYTDMNSLFYHGLNGYGVLLTLLTSVTAASTLATGARFVTTGGASESVTIALASLGAFHTFLVGVDTWLSPKSRAKPYMVAEQQYTRLLKKLKDSEEAPPAATLEDPLTTLHARVKKAEEDFAQLRAACPYVYLNKDGREILQARMIKRALGFGMLLECLQWVHIEMPTRPPRKHPYAQE